MIEHHFHSKYAKYCHFCRRRSGHQPGGGRVILVRRKVAGKEVETCKTCSFNRRMFTK